jgi:hypothetical protein
VLTVSLLASQVLTCFVQVLDLDGKLCKSV